MWKEMYSPLLFLYEVLSVCLSALSADCTLKGGNNGADANDNATGQSERRAVMENVLSTK